MSASCFYKAKVEGYQPVSFLLLEAVSDRFEKNPETPLQDLLQDACQFCYGPSHGIDLPTLAITLQSVIQETSKEQAPPPKPKRSFGTAYMKWLAETEPEQLCMLLANWDMDKARSLYCEADHRDVKAMSEVFVELEWNRVQAAYECSMYGFGGGYKGDSGGEAEDLTQENKAAENKIKALGF